MHIINQAHKKSKEQRRDDTIHTWLCAIGVIAVMFTCLSILEWRYSQIDTVYQETLR